MFSIKVLVEQRTRGRYYKNNACTMMNVLAVAYPKVMNVQYTIYLFRPNALYSTAVLKQSTEIKVITHGVSPLAYHAGHPDSNPGVEGTVTKCTTWVSTLCTV